MKYIVCCALFAGVYLVCESLPEYINKLDDRHFEMFERSEISKEVATTDEGYIITNWLWEHFVAAKEFAKQSVNQATAPTIKEMVVLLSEVLRWPLLCVALPLLLPASERWRTWAHLGIIVAGAFLCVYFADTFIISVAGAWDALLSFSFETLSSDSQKTLEQIEHLTLLLCGTFVVFYSFLYNRLPRLIVISSLAAHGVYGLFLDFVPGGLDNMFFISLNLLALVMNCVELIKCRFYQNRGWIIS